MRAHERDAKYFPRMATPETGRGGVRSSPLRLERRDRAFESHRPDHHHNTNDERLKPCADVVQWQNSPLVRFRRRFDSSPLAPSTSNARRIPVSSSGRITDFESVDRGSNPRTGATTYIEPILCGAVQMGYGSMRSVAPNALTESDGHDGFNSASNGQPPPRHDYADSPAIFERGALRGAT